MSQAQHEIEKITVNRDSDHVFISYTSADENHADSVVEVLERSGFRCWYMKRDVPAGQDYADIVSNRIDKAQGFLLLHSQQTDQSKGCKRESHLADDKGIPLLRLRLGDFEETGTLKYLFGGQQYVSHLEEDWSAQLVTGLTQRGIKPTLKTGGRRTYSWDHRADHVTFNSIIDNPKYGDERNFVVIRELGQEHFQNEITLKPGEEYEVRVYFHNNAMPILNTKRHKSKGIARDSRLSIDMPSGLEPGERARITGTINARNAVPPRIWNQVWIESDASSSLYLRYRMATARIYSNGSIDGSTIGNQLFTKDGTMIGFTGHNGLVPGGEDFMGYVTYRFVADFVDMHLKLDRVPRPEEVSDFPPTCRASQPGDIESYRMLWRNTGSMQMNNINAILQLRKGLSMVPGSVVLINSANRTGLHLQEAGDRLTSKNGINVGNYTPGGDFIMYFQVKLYAEAALNKPQGKPEVSRVIVASRNASRAASFSL